MDWVHFCQISLKLKKLRIFSIKDSGHRHFLTNRETWHFTESKATGLWKLSVVVVHTDRLVHESVVGEEVEDGEDGVVPRAARRDLVARGHHVLAVRVQLRVEVVLGAHGQQLLRCRDVFGLENKKKSFHSRTQCDKNHKEKNAELSSRRKKPKIRGYENNAFTKVPLTKEN